MFLGSKEIWHEKGKYSLIILLITLISFLTFFLSSLANGLATSNKTSLDNLSSDYKGIIINENANSNLLASKLAKPDDDKPYLNVSNGVLKLGKQQTNVVLMNSNKKITPKIVKGHLSKSDDEIVISNTLRNELKVNLNDEITINNDKKYRIVGFCKDSQYQTQDVAYVNDKQFMDINPSAKGQVNALLVNKKETIEDGKYFTINQLIQELPGYKPQNMTFSMMIGFLIVISATIVAIFIFILTIQKTELFAVLKIRGYRNGFITRSIMTQVLIIISISLIAALAMTVVMGNVLPKSMFFKIDYMSLLAISCLMIASSLIGGLFSVLRVRKINPTQALRG